MATVAKGLTEAIANTQRRRQLRTRSDGDTHRKENRSPRSDHCICSICKLYISIALVVEKGEDVVCWTCASY